MPDVDIAGRVRQVWQARGESQSAFAARVSIEESAFSRGLNGQRRFTSVELARIADVTGVSIDWLVTGSTPPGPSMAARVGDRPEIGGIDEARRVADRYGRQAETLTDVGAPLRVPPLPVPPPVRGRDVDRGERMADTALGWIEEHEDAGALESVSRFLSDLPGLVEDVFGINVAIQPLGRGFDGLSWSRGDFRLALLNSENPWTRQRYTLAHEIGHILFDDAQVLRIDQDVTARGDDGSERRASAFAAAFLMPARLVMSSGADLDQTEDFCSLVGRFNVSPAALAWRLFNLGLISGDRRAELGMLTTGAAARTGGWGERYATYAVQQTQARRPRLLASAALSAFDAGLVSARLPASVLDIDPGELMPEPEIKGRGDTDDFRP